jgi:hypothetical protein
MLALTALSAGVNETLLALISTAAGGVVAVTVTGIVAVAMAVGWGLATALAVGAKVGVLAGVGSVAAAAGCRVDVGVGTCIAVAWGSARTAAIAAGSSNRRNPGFARLKASSAISRMSPMNRRETKTLKRIGHLFIAGYHAVSYHRMYVCV